MVSPKCLLFILFQLCLTAASHSLRKHLVLLLMVNAGNSPLKYLDVRLLRLDVKNTLLMLLFCLKGPRVFHIFEVPDSTRFYFGKTIKVMWSKNSRRMAFLRPVLYGSWSSSCTHRVRIALQLKGIDYEMRPIRREELVNINLILEYSKLDFEFRSTLNFFASIPVLPSLFLSMESPS